MPDRAVIHKPGLSQTGPRSQIALIDENAHPHDTEAIGALSSCPKHSLRPFPYELANLIDDPLPSRHPRRAGMRQSTATTRSTYLNI